MKAGGIIRRKARSKPGLKLYHKKNRKRFAKEQRDRKWNLVCWSDEVHFYSNGKSGNVTVLRRIGEEYFPETTVPIYKVAGFTVSCWGCFMGLERGPFVFFDRDTKFNAERYINEVFILYFLPFYLKMRIKYGIGVIFQKDNMLYH